MASQNGVDDARAVIAIFKRGKCRRSGRRGRRTGADEFVDISEHVAECIGPAFLMSARQVCVAARAGTKQLRILRQNRARRRPPSDPELVLLFLAPPKRAAGAARFEPEIILM